MSDAYKFVKIQHHMINVCHVVSVTQRPDASENNQHAWTLDIQTTKGEIKMEHYPESEVHAMFDTFVKLLSTQ